jgi:hypothetical protein
MEFKKVNHNTIDVFFGKGWDQWARFKIAHKKEGNTKCYQVAGNRISKEQHQNLEEFFNG